MPQKFHKIRRTRSQQAMGYDSSSLCFETDMEIGASVRAWLMEDLSQIVGGYVECIKLNVGKPLY